MRQWHGKSPPMDRYQDPYDRLATLMWLLTPDDVARLVAVADRTATGEPQQSRLGLVIAGAANAGASRHRS